ncbi:MAG TPA: S9 family peptidase [Gemmatimonadaceae bacterium]|nr:S9 family peptidase [Gemmatimonadaceae bacterium]
MSATRHLAVLALVCAPSLAAAQEAPSDTLLTVGHYFDLEQVSDPQISPDGSQIVYSRRWVNKLEDKYETTLWIMRADGSRNRVLTKGSSPQWSPDGTRIAYLADGEPKGAQIYVRWVDGDPGPTQITHVTESPADIHWSPDGKSIGFTMFVAKPAVWQIDMPKPPDSAHWTKSPRIVETLHFREDRRGFQEPGFRHLFVASIDGGPARQITHGDWNVGSRFDGLGGPVGWDWTVDGKGIIVDGWADPDGDYQYRSSNLYAVDPNTGATHVLTAERGNWHSPVVSPDGKHIAYSGFASTAKTYTTSGLYVMDIDGTHARLLTTAMDRDASDLHWAPDNSGIYFAAEDHGTRNVSFVALAAGAAARSVTSGPVVVTLGSVSKTGVAALTRSTTQRPADVARIDLKTKGEIVQLTRVNDAALARIHLGTLEEINYVSSGGARIQGWIVKPPGFDQAKKYPLIMEIHGGPHGAYNAAFNYMFQNFAANDFVVLYVNPRGSTGYGSAFGAAISKAYPSVDYDDLMAGVDTVVARGYVDSKRMFVGGCSGGGVLTSWVIGHTTRFAAAAVRCPVIDWISMTGETDIPLFTEGWFDKPFWEDPEPWLKESPLMYVSHVTTPTLIMTGDLDLRTPMPQSEEYYVALKMRHVPTTLLRFEGEYHGTGGQKPTNFIRTQLYMMSWYKRYSSPAASASASASGGP